MSSTATAIVPFGYGYPLASAVVGVPAISDSQSHGYQHVSSLKVFGALEPLSSFLYTGENFVLFLSLFLFFSTISFSLI